MPGVRVAENAEGQTSQKRKQEKKRKEKKEKNKKTGQPANSSIEKSKWNFSLQ